MKLPDVIETLVKTQNSFDSAAYANCFSESAIVVDEGRTYKGKPAIKEWIMSVNKGIKPVMKPLEYSAGGAESILLAEVSGDFEGSPVKLKYHHTLENGLIKTLNIKP